MRRLGTDGKRAVTNGADVQDLIKAGGLILILAGLVVVINTGTRWVEAPDVARWQPLTWEASSWVGLAFALWVPWLAAARAPADNLLSGRWGPRLGFVGGHALAVVVFSAVHVAVFVAVRHLVYGFMGDAYRFDGRYLYEFRLDLVSYMLVLSAFWSVALVRRNAREEVRPVSFDIRDGARIIRVPLSDILAVTAAGNYVEFVLQDGRRPLMRATLAAVEERLAPVGFVRTHRSWLANSQRMTGLEPSGSGDWTLMVEQTPVPVSRRYPEALERLRG